MSSVSQRVIIAGAGPVGCTAALILAQAHIPVTLVEACDSLPTDLRASTFHPPTLDMLDRIGLTERLIPQGLVARTYQYRDRSSGRYAEFDLGLLEGVVRHPFRLQCEQYKLTRTVVDMLAEYPHAEVRMGTAAIGVAQQGETVTATLQHDGREEQVTGRFLIGTDGARSVVRKQLDIDFEGFTYPEQFLVISTDFPFEKTFSNLAHVSYVSDAEEWCTVLRVVDSWRVLFPTAPDATPEAICDPDAVEARLQRLAPHAARFNVPHISLYRIHQRVARQYRRGNVLLAGDAAHVNNPLGGMGMNGGLHDVVNLCDKLIAVLGGGGDKDALLDLYERQRRSTTVDFIQAQTIQNKKNIEEQDSAARLARIDMLSRIAADPEQAVTYLRRNNMIDSLERSYAIT